MRLSQRRCFRVAQVRKDRVPLCGQQTCSIVDSLANSARDRQCQSNQRTHPVLPVLRGGPGACRLTSSGNGPALGRLNPLLGWYLHSLGRAALVLQGSEHFFRVGADEVFEGGLRPCRLAMPSSLVWTLARNLPQTDDASNPGISFSR